MWKFIKRVGARIQGVMAPITSKYNDNFRVRVVETHDGTISYYPEYSEGALDPFKHIILINGKMYKLVGGFDDTETALDSQSEANSYIDGYRRKLAKDRANDIVEETVIPVTN